YKKVIRDLIKYNKNVNYKKVVNLLYLRGKMLQHHIDNKLHRRHTINVIREFYNDVWIDILRTKKRPKIISLRSFIFFTYFSSTFDSIPSLSTEIDLAIILILSSPTMTSDFSFSCSIYSLALSLSFNISFIRINASSTSFLYFSKEITSANHGNLSTKESYVLRSLISPLLLPISRSALITAYNNHSFTFFICELDGRKKNVMTEPTTTTITATADNINSQFSTKNIIYIPPNYLKKICANAGDTVINVVIIPITPVIIKPFVEFFIFFSSSLTLPSSDLDSI